MWNRVLGINSFIVMPIAGIFFVYAAGRALILWEWKLFVIAFIFAGLAVIAEVVLGILSD